MEVGQSPSMLLFILLVAIPPISCMQVPLYGEPCPVGLPQASGRQCQDLRRTQLRSIRSKIQLAPVMPHVPIMVLNMTSDQMKKHFLEDPFERVEFMLYLQKTAKGSNLLKLWQQKHGHTGITKMSDYANIYGFFRKAQKTFGTHFRLPSDEEPFRDITRDFMDDQVFAEQRLAGLNPMALVRLSVDKGPVGLKWDKFKLKLNPTFNWASHVQSALGRNRPLEKEIRDKLVFAVHYPLLDNVPAVPDIMEPSQFREMWTSTSPIAIFVVDPATRSKLKPVAIQLDSKPDAPVYTPNDKAMWPLAKMLIQGADLGYNQMVEHLVKTHLLMEPFCVSKERRLSEYHPLHQLLKYHCRGVSITNKLAFHLLLGKGMYLHRLFPYGHTGATTLALRAYQHMSWDDTDFEGNLRKRGLMRDALNFFPYRNDGILVYRTIARMISEYVNIYYKCDRDVRKDSELQHYVNELSADGWSSSGRGPIKGLPSSLSTRGDLCELLTRLVWQMSGQHSAVNFPISDYGGYTPNMPTKLYDDHRVPANQFSVYNLPNANISAHQALVALSLGNFRFDALFDYGPELPHKPARELVSKWFRVLQVGVTRNIEMRNKRRKRAGHVTYPYLLPRWIPNGIQT